MSKQRASMPGLRGTEHIGFTVSDLQQAVSFFVDVIGCGPIYETGPFSMDGRWMEANLALPAETVLKKLQFLRCDAGTNFEIFEYETPAQNRQPPCNSDIGEHHLAFYVDDIEKAVVFLQTKGVHVLGEPKLSPSGPSAGQTWVYFVTPLGVQLELGGFPDGKVHEKATHQRL